MVDDRKTRTFYNINNIALLVKNLSGKILYLFILIPQLDISGYVTEKLFFSSVILRSQ